MKYGRERMHMSNEAPLLEVRNLTKHFPVGHGKEVHAVNGVSFTLEKGETLGIVGESGCGKSSMGRTILKVHEPTSGQIIFEGNDITNLSNKKMFPYRKKMQMIFQDPYASLNPRFTVGEIIEEPMIIHKMGTAHERKAIVQELIETVGLKPDHIRRYPHEFSGGQRQRVAMGRAIVRSPKVFLMDEPLSNLDAKLRVQMRVEISKLHQRLQTTIIYVTHDQTEAMTLGTRIVVLKDGIIQQVDTPQNLYNTPNNIFVAGFIGSPQMNLIDAEVKANGSQVDLVLSDTVTITLPAEKSKKLIDGNYVGKTVVVGIRPEDVKDDAEFIAKNADSKFTATVKVYELLGAEVNLHYEIGDVTCTAKVNPRTTARPGDEVTFAMDVERLHVFDKETEIVITH